MVPAAPTKTPLPPPKEPEMSNGEILYCILMTALIIFVAPAIVWSLSVLLTYLLTPAANAVLAFLDFWGEFTLAAPKVPGLLWQHLLKLWKLLSQ